MREYSPVYFWALDNPYEQHLFPPALVALLTIDTVEDLQIHKGSMFIYCNLQNCTLRNLYFAK